MGVGECESRRRRTLYLWPENRDIKRNKQAQTCRHDRLVETRTEPWKPRHSLPKPQPSLFRVFPAPSDSVQLNPSARLFGALTPSLPCILVPCSNSAIGDTAIDCCTFSRHCRIISTAAMTFRLIILTETCILLQPESQHMGISPGVFAACSTTLGPISACTR